MKTYREFVAEIYESTYYDDEDLEMQNEAFWKHPKDRAMDKVRAQEIKVGANNPEDNRPEEIGKLNRLVQAWKDAPRKPFEVRTLKESKKDSPERRQLVANIKQHERTVEKFGRMKELSNSQHHEHNQARAALKKAIDDLTRHDYDNSEKKGNPESGGGPFFGSGWR
jgi:hypothetical protein